MIHSATANLQEVLADGERTDESQARLMLVAIALTVASVMVLRHTGRQEERLQVAIEENQRVLGDFRRLAEGMPVGPFT